jgi:type 1 glutamine amidotransferase
VEATVRAEVITGTGRYADPWHPYVATSERVAALLGSAGFDVTVETDVDGALARLQGVDLLVVNAGDPWRAADDEAGDPAREAGPPPESVAGLERALDRGIGVLALHAALASLRDYPAWAAATGAIWLPGLSWHPPRAAVRVHGGHLPDGTSVPDVQVQDELYQRLQPVGGRHVVAWHEHGGERVASAWVREHRGSRVAVDALGHDAESYDSPTHRELVRALALWVVGRD